MDQGPDYDAADQANRDAEEQIVLTFRKAMAVWTEDEARLACWAAGIQYRLIEPQRRAA